MCVWSNIRCVDCPCAHTRVMTKHSKYSRLIGHEHRARIARFEPGRSFSRALCLFSHLFEVTIFARFLARDFDSCFYSLTIRVGEKERKTRELLFAYTHTHYESEKKKRKEKKLKKTVFVQFDTFFFDFVG